jgi:hypothetical protein
VTGWWKERPHLEQWTSRARYSLVVTIETPKADVNLYALIEAETAISTEVGVEMDLS